MQPQSYCYPKPKIFEESGAILKEIIYEDVWVAKQYCLKSRPKTNVEQKIIDCNFKFSSGDISYLTEISGKEQQITGDCGITCNYIYETGIPFDLTKMYNCRLATDYEKHPEDYVAKIKEICPTDSGLISRCEFQDDIFVCGLSIPCFNQTTYLIKNECEKGNPKCR